MAVIVVRGFPHYETHPKFVKVVVDITILYDEQVCQKEVLSYSRSPRSSAPPQAKDLVPAVGAEVATSHKEKQCIIAESK